MLGNGEILVTSVETQRSGSHSHRADMELHQVLHMNGGEDEISYAKNSSHQKLALIKVKPFLENCIEELLCINLPKCLKIADLGCSSGPNTFLTMLEIIESIDKACRKLNHEPPMIQFSLNDLFGNDFNSVFKSLPNFYDKLEKENGRQYGSCLVAAMPGSFYGRLFPNGSLDFIHSSYALHWLSQVPSGLMTKSGIPSNKGSIYCAKASPPGVHKAYLNQFTNDFTTFLRMHSEELVSRGQMLLTFMCKGDEIDGPHYLGIFDIAINDLVVEGLVEEEKLDTFNMPMYTPSMEEVRHIVEEEGSFEILYLGTFKLRFDASFLVDDIDNQLSSQQYDENVRADHVAALTRAVHEPILASHFGEAIMPDLFHRYATNTAKFLRMGKGFFNNLIISLAKK